MNDFDDGYNLENPDEYFIEDDNYMFYSDELMKYNIDCEALYPIEYLSEGCMIIEEGLLEFRESDDRNVFPVIDALIAAAREETELWAPILEVSTDSMDYNWDADEPQITLRMLDSPSGDVHALFTSMEEVQFGGKTEVIRVKLREHLVMLLSDDKVTGLVVNPFSGTAFLTRKQLEYVVNYSLPPAPDQLILEYGVRSYLKGDYENAVKYYRMAAEQGNVTALSNLGYCYYYGRGMEPDKQQAYLCWSKAAVFGDIPATYKMADMLMNGDLPMDPVYARSLYHKAYHDAQEFMDPNYYPDICLRVLKYCRDDIDPDSILYIAEDAVFGFRQKIDSGHTDMEQSLQEAEEILNSLIEFCS